MRFRVGVDVSENRLEPLTTNNFPVVGSGLMISKRLRDAIKTSGVQQYVWAQAAGLNPSTFSAWMNGIAAVPRGDPRITQLGGLLGIPPHECFGPPQSRANATKRLRQQVAAKV